MLNIIPIPSGWYKIILDYGAYAHLEDHILVLNNGQRVIIDELDKI